MADVHPGLAILRALIPNTDARRAFVVLACSDTWNPAALVRAVNESNALPVNVSPAQASAVRAFVESI